MISKTYEEWKFCIIEKCGISLTFEYIEERLSVLSNEQNKERNKFIELYGQEHLNNVIDWFKIALNETKQASRRCS
jgi:hypothetical protein